MPRTQDAEAATNAARAQRYDNILVHVQPGLTSSRRTELAASLARSFDARLIGVGAETIEPVVFADPYMPQVTTEAYVQLQKQLDADLDSAERAFYRDAAQADHEWRRLDTSPERALAATARAADLIVMGANDPAAKDYFGAPDIGDVIMTAGRPVLVAPEFGPNLKGSAVVVAWKDTREARRAVADAMPFLQRAQRVVVQAICAEEDVEQLTAAANDLADALRRKGVPAVGNVTTAPDASVAAELNAEAAAIGADLIVAGAYGHSRMAEWAFGGVTRALLKNPQRFVLLSH